MKLFILTVALGTSLMGPEGDYWHNSITYFTKYSFKNTL